MARISNTPSVEYIVCACPFLRDEGRGCDSLWMRYAMLRRAELELMLEAFVDVVCILRGSTKKREGNEGFTKVAFTVPHKSTARMLRCRKLRSKLNLNCRS